KCLFNKLALHKYNKNHLKDIIKEVLNDKDNENILKNLCEEKNKYEERLSNLIDLKLDNFDNVKVYEIKEKELNDKINEINLKIQKCIKNKQKGNNFEKQLNQIKHMLNKDISIDGFDKDLFKILIKKIIIGDYENDDFNPRIVKFVLNMDKEIIFFKNDFNVSNCA
ncbi:hypothetical protein IKE96_00715, partial [bacterium]|nr:hypothetical protein [bacterium]